MPRAKASPLLISRWNTWPSLSVLVTVNRGVGSAFPMEWPSNTLFKSSTTLSSGYRRLEAGAQSGMLESKSTSHKDSSVMRTEPEASAISPITRQQRCAGIDPQLRRAKGPESRSNCSEQHRSSHTSFELHRTFILPAWTEETLRLDVRAVPAEPLSLATRSARMYAHADCQRRNQTLPNGRPAAATRSQGEIGPEHRAIEVGIDTFTRLMSILGTAREQRSVRQ